MDVNKDINNNEVVVKYKVSYIIFIGLQFLGLFTSFNTTQNLQTTQNKTLGFWVLSVLYITFSLSNFIAPIFISKLGISKSLAIGASGYVLFIAANIQGIPVLLIIGAICNGFGAAVLWTSQGTYVTQWSRKEDLGKNSGIFFAIFQLNQLIGNLFTGIVYQNFKDIPNLKIYIYIAFTILAAVSSATFFFLKEPPKQFTSPKSTRAKLLETFSIFKEKYMILLIAVMIYSGLSQSFFFGVYTKILGEVGQESLIGLVMSVFGITNAVCSYSFGKLGDIIGWKPIIILGTITALICHIVLLLFKTTTIPIIYFYLLAACLGISDASFYVTLYATIGLYFHEKESAAFAGFRFLQSTSTAIYFSVSAYVTLPIIIVVVDSFLIIGVLNYWISTLYFKINEDKESLIKKS